jgi:hypothetical protein
MAPFLQLALWNANGLHQHAEELKTFISLRNIDIMLISETYFTDKCYLRLPNHPAGTARGGSAIIIKRSIKHHQLNHSEDFLQATSVSVEDYAGPSDIDSSQEETTTPSALPGDPDLFHLVDVRSSKQWNNLISITFLLENQPTGLPTAINSLIYWTSVSPKAFPANPPCLRLAWTYLPTTHPFWLLSAQVCWTKPLRHVYATVKPTGTILATSTHRNLL